VITGDARLVVGLNFIFLLCVRAISFLNGEGFRGRGCSDLSLAWGFFCWLVGIFILPYWERAFSVCVRKYHCVAFLLGFWWSTVDFGSGR
jgi:hypothetical protein